MCRSGEPGDEGRREAWFSGVGNVFEGTGTEEYVKRFKAVGPGVDVFGCRLQDPAWGLVGESEY